MRKLSSLKEEGFVSYANEIFRTKIQIKHRNQLLKGGIYGVDDCDRRISLNLGGGIYSEHNGIKTFSQMIQKTELGRT